MDKKFALISAVTVLAALVFTLVTASLTTPDRKQKDENISVSTITKNGEIAVSLPEGSYSVSVTAVFDVAPDTDAAEPPTAERVAVVVYEYTNDGVENGVSIGNTHFKAYDKNGKELEQFPQKGLFEAGEAGDSDTYTASVAFALNNSENFLKIEYYNDTTSEKPDAVFEKIW